MARDRRVLLGLFDARDWPRRDQSVSARNQTHGLSTRGSLARIFKLRRFGVVSCASINGLRLRALRVSVPRASVFHFRKTAQRRGGSIFLALLPGGGLCLVANSSSAAENNSVCRFRSVHCSVAKRA